MNQWVRMLLKNRLYQLLCILFLFFLVCCESGTSEKSINLYRITGESQGTTYTIQIYDKDLNFNKVEIDSILEEFDQELSTYQYSSLISRFNQMDFKDTILYNSSKFVTMLQLSDSVYQLSDGLFDPSIKPLMDLWGFDEEKGTVPSRSAIDSVLRYVDFKKGTHFDYSKSSDSSIQVMKYSPSFQLDFNGIAQGYAVDVLMDFLKSRGHKNIYAELGGEIALSGFKVNNENWRIGVETPIENNKTSEKIVQKTFTLSNKCIATSGNYRKYFEVNGEKYAHTLNPNTGFQNHHNLLSATVFSKSCAVSDAFATYFMLVGVAGTQDFLLTHPDLGLDVFLIYDELNEYKTYLSKGLISAAE